MSAARKIEKTAEAYRSIGEAASELGLPTHVLRYWESQFPRLIKPVKRPDGRRMFRPGDIDALHAIQTLVHARGMTLKGARNLLADQGVDVVLAGEARLGPDETRPAVHEMQDRVRQAFGDAMSQSRPVAEGATGSPERLRNVLSEMTDLKRRLDEMRQRTAA